MVELELKLSEVLNLDCKNKYYLDLLIQKFDNIPFIKENGETYLKDYKENTLKLANIAEYFLSKADYRLNCIFYRTTTKYALLENDNSGKQLMASSKTLEELYIKLAIYGFYKAKQLKAKLEC